MKKWVIISSETHSAELLVEKNSGGIVFICGTVDDGAEIVPINSLHNLQLYGFEYPDYIAEITEKLETHEQEEPNTFI